MKFITIYQGDNTIELYNTILGKETVKVNGEVVSTKYSIAGTRHLFVIPNGEQPVECALSTGFGFHGAVVDFYVDGKPVIQSSRSGCITLLTIIIVLVFLLYLLKSRNSYL